MRLLIPNFRGSIFIKNPDSRGEYGEILPTFTEVEVEGILTSRRESADLGSLDTRHSTYDYALALTGFSAEAASGAKTNDEVFIDGTKHVIREVSKAERSIAVGRKRIQKNIVLFLEAAE